MTGIVLQARMGSSRLPGKVMMGLCDKPMLGHVMERLRLAKKADVLIVATTVNRSDDEIERYSTGEGIEVYRGSEKDVLDRYYRASIKYGLNHIVRATADNPLVDPWEIDRLIELHIESQSDYTHSIGILPIGVGAECFSFESIKTSWEKGMHPNHREHVNEYILENSDGFKITVLDVPEDKRAPSLRFTVDTSEDLDRMKSIYKALYRPGHIITTEEAIKSFATLSA